MKPTPKAPYAMKTPLSCMLALCLCLFAPLVHAQENDALKASQDQVKRLQQRIKNLEQEKSLISADKSKAESEASAAAALADKSSKSLAGSSRKLTMLQTDVELLKQTLTDLQARQATMLQEKLKSRDERILTLQQQLSATQAQLGQLTDAKRIVDASLANTETALTSTQETVTQCTLRNQSLFKTGVTLLKKYEEKSCLNSVLEKEPLTKLKQVGAENRLEEYREQMEKDLIVDLESERLKIATLKASLEKAEQDKRAKAELDKKAEQKAQQAKVRERKKKEQKELEIMTKPIKQSLERMEW
jgi:chromosome segregation ATPase